MKIISQDLRDGEKLPERHVFNGMGYQGDNISPHLAWDDVPPGTKSFVVTCYDPDAPTGSGWWHWIVANLPADTRVLPQGSGSDLTALPEGAIQTRTDFGKAGYGGAHRQKARRTGIFSPFMPWTLRRSMWMKARAARWLALTCIFTRWEVRRLPRCIRKKSRAAASPHPACTVHSSRKRRFTGPASAALPGFALQHRG